MEPSKALQATATSDTERDSDCHAALRPETPFSLPKSPGGREHTRQGRHTNPTTSGSGRAMGSPHPHSYLRIYFWLPSNRLRTIRGKRKKID